MKPAQKHSNSLTRWLSIACFILLFACSQVIDLDVDQTGGEVVIYGRITDGSMGNEVTVSLTTDHGGIPEPLSDAIVKVIDEDGVEEYYTEALREPGVYRTSGDVLQARSGKAYRLEVEVLGKNYSTDFQIMPEIIGEDRLDWELVEERDISEAGASVTGFVVKIYGQTTFQELPEEFFVRWNIEEVYTVFGMVLPRSWYPRYTPQQCYIINNLSQQEVFLLDGTRVRDRELGRQLFATRPIDRSFGVKHYFNLVHSAVNRETHDYWAKVKTVATRQGSIFDTPPAPIPGNILSDDPNERPFGFFEVTSVDTFRLVMTNNDIPEFWDDPCELNGDEWLPVFTVPFECVPCLIERKIVEETCIFCSRLPNSTLTRPSYF